MSETTVIRIKHLCSGQPRPYADSIYSAEITVERHGVFTDGKVVPRFLEAEEVQKIARQFVSGWQPEGEGDWASPRLKECTPLGPYPDWADKAEREKHSGSWRITVQAAYTD